MPKSWQRYEANTSTIQSACISLPIHGIAAFCTSCKRATTVGTTIVMAKKKKETRRTFAGTSLIAQPFPKRIASIVLTNRYAKSSDESTTDLAARIHVAPAKAAHATAGKRAMPLSRKTKRFRLLVAKGIFSNQISRVRVNRKPAIAKLVRLN